MLWTNTFYPLASLFSEPMKSFLVLSDEGPECWAASDHPEVIDDVEHAGGARPG
ncbi:hypothetical protein ACNHYB_14565 [Isoptericola jiangsuensis]|uniref:hypothetical protein n=1 Tax=Isoptericola jiangsuensis TaxID=548579 RepID=UPI003AAF1050